MSVVDDVLGGIGKTQELLGIPNINKNPLTVKRPKRVKASELWVMAGGPPEEAKTAGEVAYGESRCNNRATSWTGCCHCIWQIHGLHHRTLGYESAEEMEKDLKSDPLKCAKAAVKVWRSAGNSWSPWEDTAYVGSGRDCTVTVKDASLLSSAVGAVGDAVEAPVDSLTGALGSIADFFHLLGQADTWIRIGKVALGAALILLAVRFIL